jgi:hypothetical protein
MVTVRRSLRRLLRASVLALLVLGLLVKPVMVLCADAHEIQHALLAAAEPAGIPHFHGDRDDPQPNSDATHGTRNLAQSASFAYAPITPVMAVLAPSFRPSRCLRRRARRWWSVRPRHPSDLRSPDACGRLARRVPASTRCHRVHGVHPRVHHARTHHFRSSQ